MASVKRSKGVPAERGQDKPAPELDMTIREAAQNFVHDHYHLHHPSRGAPPLIDDDLGIGD